MEETNALLREIRDMLKILVAKKEITRCKRAAVQAGRFPEFWEAYPRAKTGKLGAEKAYEKAIGSDTHDAIMAGVARFARELKKSPRDTSLIPHAATWLNQGRWMDEDEDKKIIKVEGHKDALPYIAKEEQEKAENKRLSEEWTDAQIAKLSQDEVFAIKKEIMLKWPEAIRLKPSMGTNFYRMEVRKKYRCPYER